MYELLAKHVGKKDALRVSLVTVLTTKYGAGGYVWLREHGFQSKGETVP